MCLTSNEELVKLIQDNINTMDNMTLLYEQTSRFIYAIACKYKGYAELDDLLQEGYFGLHEAVKGYSSGQEVKFLTYAEYWIRQVIQRYVYSNGRSIRIPEHTLLRIGRYKKLQEKFRSEYDREPTDEEISSCLSLSVGQVKKLKKNVYMDQIASTDTTVGEEDGGLTLGDTIASDVDLEQSVIDNLGAEQLKVELWSIVDSLEENQARAIRYRFDQKMSLNSAAEIMGVSEEVVRRYEAKGLKKLGNKYTIKKLAEEYDIIQRYAYHGSVGSFHRTWTSSTEYTAMKLMER